MFIEMCPPLLSESLDITCTFNGNYSNCENLSIPDTVATPKCKPIYSSSGRQQTSLELRCQSNGTWNKPLHGCKTCICIIYLIHISLKLIYFLRIYLTFTVLLLFIFIFKLYFRLW